jgi:thymidylate kinase
LKYRDRDGLKDILSIRSAGLPLHIRKEIEWLREQTTRERVAQMLENISDKVPSDLVLEFLDTVGSNPRAGRRLLRLRRDVRRALQGYQRQDRWEASHKYFRTIWQRRSFLNRAAGKRMTLENGGLRVAFIGADGAGKTTLIRELTRWLSWRLTVRTFYMGSSQPFLVTRAVKGISKLTQRVHTGVQRIFGARSPLARPFGRLSQHLAHFRYLSEARDRYRRYEASCLEAKQGAIVFYDRYPLDSIQIFGRPVDGPRIPPSEDGRMGRISERLSRAEQELYRKIRPPENVVILQVSPEVSQMRKPDHKWELIAAKSQALEAVTKNGFELTKIDAHQPVEEVLRQVKSVLWRLMG